jgi:hypothetical protein
VSIWKSADVDWSWQFSSVQRIREEFAIFGAEHRLEIRRSRQKISAGPPQGAKTDEAAR